MSEELKPCPFCGANDPYHEISEDEIHVWVACGNCFATSSRIHTKHNTAPDFAWNTRPIEDALRAELDAWKAAHKRLFDEMTVVIKERDTLRAKWVIASEALKNIKENMPPLWVRKIIDEAFRRSEEK